MNPLKAYRKGLLPPALLESYERKWVYNPLRVAGQYNLVGYVRGVLWFLLAFCIGVLLIQQAYALDEKLPFTQAEELLFKGVLLAAIVIGIILTITSNTYKMLEERILETQNRTSKFMKEFAQIFTVRSPSSFTTLQSLCPRVTIIISCKSAMIIRLQLVGINTNNENSDFSDLWIRASDVGLGFEPKMYFKRAKKKLNTYKCFDWVI